MLEGEVYNGGFCQYFDSSSGDHYRYAELGSMRLNVPERLTLLRAAKTEIFGSDPVATDQARRFNYGNRFGGDSRLEELDSQYCALEDDLPSKLERFALEYGLVEKEDG